MYGIGDGAPRDLSEYAKWNRRAAEQGSPSGQFGLGLCYQMGWGVPKDSVEAYKWFNLAAAAGNDAATKSRDLLQRQMSPDQISEAQHRAQQFLPKLER